MRVLLVKPLDPYDEGYYRSFGIRMPPLGLAELAGALREAGHEVSIADRMLHPTSPEVFAKEASRYDMVGITTIASSYYPDAAAIAKAIKKADPHLITVAGGHHATFTYPLVLGDGFDYAVRGEGEVTLPELASKLEDGKAPSSVMGLAYKSDGEIKLTPPRPPMQDLDKSPMPAWDLVNGEEYRADIVEKGAKFATIETARGCPYNCDFCSVTAMWGHSWRMKSPSRIMKEVEKLEDMGYKYAFFVDDDLVIPGSEKVRQDLFSRLSRERPGLKWFAQIRADMVVRRPDVVQAAAEGGMMLAFLGIESGDDAVLKGMKKGLTTTITGRAVEILHRMGVIVFGGMILGSPYEGWDSLRRSIRYSLDLAKRGLDAIQYTIYTPLPGSASFYSLLKSRRIISFDWSKYDCLHPLIRGGVNPVWIYLASRVANYVFYVGKYLYGKAGLVIPGKPNPYIRNMGSYVMKKIPEQLFYVLKIPLDVLSVARDLARSVPPTPQQADELMKAGLQPVFPLRRAQVASIPT